MRSRSLASRVERLERSRKATRRRPTAFLRLSPEDAPEDTIEGVQRWNGPVIPRNPGEPLAALLARASAMPEHAGKTLLAVYSPELRAALKARAEPKSIAKPEPNVGIEPKPDPFALAGIGRQATAQELARMGIRSAFRQPG